MKKIVSLVVITLVLVGWGFAQTRPGMQAGRMGMHRGGGQHMMDRDSIPPRMVLRFADRIGLTADQVKKLNEMLTQHEERMIRGQADIRIKELQLRNYCNGEKIDRREMEKMAREIGDLRVRQQLDRMNLQLDVKALLNAEQRNKIEEMKKEFLRHRADRTGFHRGNRDGRPMLRQPPPQEQ